MERQLTPHFPTDLASILHRLESIDAEAYGATRNFIDGAVTYLSPYISRGVISVCDVRESLLAHYNNTSRIQKLIQELAWREYFQRVWQALGERIDNDIRQPQPGVDHHRMPTALVEARTGISAVDKGILNFYETGYLHNHLRMYVASLVCNVGRAHWRKPAQWMYYHLLDGDVASNACSWQWVAGAFSAKKYFANQENINRHLHSQQRGSFLDLPVEVLNEQPVPASLRDTTDLELTTPLPVTTRPTIRLDQPVLLYNSYNLDPRWRSGSGYQRILLLEPSHFRKYPVSQRVIDFILALATNIPGTQVFAGEVHELFQGMASQPEIISKEHQAFRHYPGHRDPAQWMYPDVEGFFPSFSAFWKRVS